MSQRLISPELLPLELFVCYLIHPFPLDDISSKWTRGEWSMKFGHLYDVPQRAGQRWLNEQHEWVMDLLTKRRVLEERAKRLAT